MLNQAMLRFESVRFRRRIGDRIAGVFLRVPVPRVLLFVRMGASHMPGKRFQLDNQKLNILRQFHEHCRQKTRVNAGTRARFWYEDECSAAAW